MKKKVEESVEFIQYETYEYDLISEWHDHEEEIKRYGWRYVRLEPKASPPFIKVTYERVCSVTKN